MIKDSNYFPKNLSKTTGLQLFTSVVIKAFATKRVALAYVDNLCFKALSIDNTGVVISDGRTLKRTLLVPV